MDSIKDFIKDKKSGKVLTPITLDECVRTRDGKTVLNLDELKENIGSLTGVVDEIYKKSTNLVDIREKKDGYYINELNGQPTPNGNHCMIQWIAVKSNETYTIGLWNGVQYGNAILNVGARIAFYKSDKSFISAFICDSVGENTFTTPNDTVFMCISWNKASYNSYQPMLCVGTILLPYEEYGSCINMELVDSYKKEETYTKKEVNSIVAGNSKKPYTSVSGSMADGTILQIAENSVCKKNIELIFCGDINTYSSVVVGYRHAYSNTLWDRVEVTNTEVIASTHNIYGDAEIGRYPHGLDIANNIQIYLKKEYKNYSFKVIVVSNGHSFEKTFNSVVRTQIVQPFAKSNGSNLSNCKFTVMYGDAEKDIYAFGDSYFNYDVTRWLYYADEQGFTKNMFIDAHPGEASSASIMAFENSLIHGKPKFVMWCMGMNDGNDSATEPSSLWKTNIEKVIAKCEELGIIPILATIPTTPTHNNEKKNEYVRNSGYRYIDFAKAVGATSNGTWYSGMLHTDNLHPTEYGARALFMQAINDFPEMMKD